MIGYILTECIRHTLRTCSPLEDQRLPLSVTAIENIYYSMSNLPPRNDCHPINRTKTPLPNFMPRGNLALQNLAGLFKIKMADNCTTRKGLHWSCASKYCKKSWKTPNVEYYTLSKVASARKTVHDAYLTVLGRQMEEVNFKEQDICSLPPRSKSTGIVLLYSVQISGEQLKKGNH